MGTHSSQVTGNQYPIFICRDCQNFRIKGTVRDRARRRLKIYGGFPPEQALPDIGIDVGVGLKADFQERLDGDAFLARSKRSIIS